MVGKPYNDETNARIELLLIVYYKSVVALAHKRKIGRAENPNISNLHSAIKNNN